MDIINMEVFTQFRLVFGIMLAILLVFLVLSLLPKSRDTMITFFSVLTVSLTHAVLAIALIFTENIFLEDFSLEGDTVTFFMFVGIIALAIINPIVYKLRSKGRKRSSYSFR